MSGGALMVLLGVIHNLLGIPALQRAVARGELAQRLAGPQMVNWLFSGVAMSLFGVLVLLAAWELGRPGRLAYRIIVLTGIFFLMTGLGAYLMEPQAGVLMFAVLGLLLCAAAVLPQRDSPAS